MFTSTSYYQQSIGLPVENDTQLTILKLADNSTTLREIGKIGSIIGTVSIAASTVFGYSPTLSISATAVSALAWFFCHKIAQSVEPQAQSMLKHFKDLEREKNNKAQEDKNRVSYQKDSSAFSLKVISAKRPEKPDSLIFEDKILEK